MTKKIIRISNFYTGMAITVFLLLTALYDSISFYQKILTLDVADTLVKMKKALLYVRKKEMDTRKKGYILFPFSLAGIYLVIENPSMSLLPYVVIAAFIGVVFTYVRYKNADANYQKLEKEIRELSELE